MAKLTSANAIKVSGWSFMVGSEDDFANFTQNELADMRKGAMERMTKTQNLMVAAVQKTLGRILPLRPVLRFRLSGGRLRMRTQMVRSALPGQPPGKITGELQRSWKRGIRRWSQNNTVLTGWVQSDHPAAGLLEFIGISGTKRLGIAQHPYYRITLAREQDNLHNALLGL